MVHQRHGGRHLRQLAVERQRDAGVRHAVHRARPRQRAGRRHRRQRHAARQLQWSADLAQQSDVHSLLQHRGVLAAGGRDVRHRRPRHDHRSGNHGPEHGPDEEHHAQPDARSVAAGARQQSAKHRPVRVDRHNHQLADIRPGDGRPPDAAPPAHDEVQILRRALRFLLVVVLLTATPHAQAPAQPPTVFRSGTELVLVNVVVRDKNGAVVRGLTRDDFIVAEDDKAQTVTSFDFEELDKADAVLTAQDDKVVLPPKPVARPADPALAAAAAPVKVDMRGRRLIVLFFDLSSMQPEEVQRAVTSAHDYIEKKLAPADMIAIASFSTSLQVVQDFTADRDQLTEAIDAFGGVNGAGFEDGGNGDPEDTSDNGNAFTADDTEFNLFNTDRRLDALQTLADQLSGIEQKKSVIYFSSGMSQSGTDNQVQLKRTVDRANRANVSIYAADMRGLQAMVPGGDATQGSRRGTSTFSGASTRNQFTSMASTQDTLTTMAEDTGGRAFFDANSFGQVFDKVVNDTSAYYVLGYSSTNPALDGRFRRIRVKLKRQDLKLEYRSGYYAPRDFQHSTKDDREQQLQDQLTSDLSSTDLSAYVSTAYFRLADNHYFVPLSVIVPGYQIPITKTTPKDKATVDVLGVVRDR